MSVESQRCKRCGADLLTVKDAKGKRWACSEGGRAAGRRTGLWGIDDGSGKGVWNVEPCADKYATCAIPHYQLCGVVARK